MDVEITFNDSWFAPMETTRLGKIIYITTNFWGNPIFVVACNDHVIRKCSIKNIKITKI